MITIYNRFKCESKAFWVFSTLIFVTMRGSFFVPNSAGQFLDFPKPVGQFLYIRFRSSFHCDSRCHAYLSFLTGGGKVCESPIRRDPHWVKKINWISNKGPCQTCYDAYLLVMTKQTNSTDKTGLPRTVLRLKGAVVFGVTHIRI